MPRAGLSRAIRDENHFSRYFSVDSEKLLVSAQQVTACVSDVLDISKVGKRIFRVACNPCPVVGCNG